MTHLLEHYCKYGDLSKVESLFQILPDGEDFMHAIYIACKYNHTDIILYFLGKSNCPKAWALIVAYAYQHSHRTVVRAILNAIDIKRLDMQFCMQHVALHGNLRLLKRITSCIKFDMYEILSYACMLQHKDIVDFIIYGNFSIDWARTLQNLADIGCVERFKVVEARCGMPQDYIIRNSITMAGSHNYFDLLKYLMDKYPNAELSIYELLRTVCKTKDITTIMFVINRYHAQYHADMSAFLDIVCLYSCELIDVYWTHPAFNVYPLIINACWGQNADVVKCFLSKLDPSAKHDPRYNWPYLLEGVCVYLDEEMITLLLPYVSAPNWPACFRTAYYQQNYDPLRYIVENQLVDLSTFNLNHSNPSRKITLLIINSLIKSGANTRHILNATHIRALVDGGLPLSYFTDDSEDMQYELATIKKIQRDNTTAISESTRLLNDLVRIIVLYLPCT